MGVQTYDVLRSGAATSFVNAFCVEEDDYNLTASDTTVPSSNGVFFYLVRAGNRCGEGVAGFSSSGNPTNASCAP
jgi:hypothetical protein